MHSCTTRSSKGLLGFKLQNYYSSNPTYIKEFCSVVNHNYNLLVVLRLLNCQSIGGHYVADLGEPRLCLLQAFVNHHCGNSSVTNPTHKP